MAYKNRIKLLYVNGPRMIAAAAIVSGLLGIPLVFHCHNRLLQREAVFLSGTALQKSRGYVIACCQFAAEPLVPYLREDRLKVIFNGVSDMGTEVSRPTGRIRRIGVVGRIEEQKGQLEFVKAAKLIAGEFPDSQFRIVGASLFSGTDYHKLVAQESVGLNVEFQGWTDDVKNALADLDLLVVPSKSVEATTRVILEAFSARVPVLAFPAGGILEILGDDVTGFLAADGSYQALAKRLGEVLRLNLEDLRAITARARQEWEKRFTLPGYQERVCGVIHRVLGW